MRVLFDKEYLSRLYASGTTDKKHRFQPDIVKKYIKVVDVMISVPNVQSLTFYKSLRYEKLVGGKAGISSVRVNDKYRIEFEEIIEGEEIIASICNIVELSNHYE